MREILFLGASVGRAGCDAGGTERSRPCRGRSRVRRGRLCGVSARSRPYERASSTVHAFPPEGYVPVSFLTNEVRVGGNAARKRESWASGSQHVEFEFFHGAGRLEDDSGAVGKYRPFDTRFRHQIWRPSSRLKKGKNARSSLLSAFLESSAPASLQSTTHDTPSFTRRVPCLNASSHRPPTLSQ
jgi:hypothetical protein